MKKFIAIGVVIALVLAIYLFDFTISRQYEYEVVSSSTDVIIADGYSTTRMTVRLTKNNKPVVGHIINVVCSNGTLPQSRLVTNADGEISLRYYAYLYLDDKLTPLEDVTFHFEDESNSKIFMIPATFEYTIPAEKPESDNVWEDWQNIKAPQEGGNK